MVKNASQEDKSGYIVISQFVGENDYKEVRMILPMSEEKLAKDIQKSLFIEGAVELDYVSDKSIGDLKKVWRYEFSNKTTDLIRKGFYYEGLNLSKSYGYYTSRNLVIESEQELKTQEDIEKAFKSKYDFVTGISTLDSDTVNSIRNGLSLFWELVDGSTSGYNDFIIRGKKSGKYFRVTADSESYGNVFKLTPVERKVESIEIVKFI